MPLSTYLPLPKLSALSLSFQARRFSSVRSLSNSHASLSQLVRRERVLEVEERDNLEVKADAVDHQDVAVDEDVAVEAALDVPTVV